MKKSPKEKKTKNYLLDLILMGVIISLSLIPRLWELRKYPPIIVDEPADLRDIFLILEKGFNFTNFAWDWSKAHLAYSVPLFFIKIIKLPPDIYTLRLATVFLSILSAPAFFLIVKKHTDRLTAFLTGMLFMNSYYFLQFSRVGGWLNVVFVNTLGLYLFLISENALEKRNKYLFGLAGIVAGLIFYSYRSGWIYIGTSFLFIVFSLVRKKEKITKTFKNIFIFLILFIATTLPWINKIKDNWEMYFLRPNVVALKNVALPYHGIYDKRQVYLYQIGTTIRSWIFLDAVDGGGYENPRYLPLRYPPVNILARIGFWVGLAIALYSFSRTYYWYIVYLLALIFGQILTVDPPNGARGLVMLPFIYLFFSLALGKFLALQDNKLYKIVVSVLVIFFAYTDFIFYQYWMTWIDAYRI